MERRMLGRTGIEVSRLCLGTLTMGPLQANISQDEGARVICEAVARGIN
ncbi:MAG: aldo/keto reductase, partial [Firmicutes bacterium]|nr:aldo/keto reductase [Bacillota bacterium]